VKLIVSKFGTGIRGSKCIVIGKTEVLDMLPDRVVLETGAQFLGDQVPTNPSVVVDSRQDIVVCAVGSRVVLVLGHCGKR